MTEHEKVEFIESYIKVRGGDYQWNDNHGELIRCKDCKKHGDIGCQLWTDAVEFETKDDWYCADGEKRVK